MKLLLDTHAVLWWVTDDPQLPAAAATLIADDTNDVLLSAVVVWEIAIKRGLGKLTAPAGLDELLLAGGATALPITIAHARRVERLPDRHRDPFDRMLVAQAFEEDAVIVTRDAALGGYGVATAWA
ncbi:MAG: type toxin-antitoxin system VapC family toxin [Solirubrobacterales bacterium]|nr:type toxin-antitoxin system VapC family toxin [Solirubrobacterales bacterium]